MLASLHDLGGLSLHVNKALGVRKYRTTLTKIADHLHESRDTIRAHLEDLERLGFLVFFSDKSTLGEGDHACVCRERRASVVPTTTPYGTRSKRSGEEDREGEESVGPKVPFRREAPARETILPKKIDLDRARREERLALIECKHSEDLNSNDLAILFWDRVKRYSSWTSHVPGAINHTALARTFAEWIRDGSPPELIREMIEVFARDRKFQAEGDVAWKVFINKRALLAQRAANRVKSRTDDLGWDDPLESDDTDLGWGDAEKYTNPEH
ncbi:MAG: hypothetical protein ABR616_15655 [Dermatophilaceae bacterium]